MTSYFNLTKNWCGGLCAAMLGLISVNAAQGQITTLANFNGLDIGEAASLTLSGNTFYGTTTVGNLVWRSSKECS